VVYVLGAGRAHLRLIDRFGFPSPIPIPLHRAAWAAREPDRAAARARLVAEEQARAARFAALGIVEVGGGAEGDGSSTDAPAATAGTVEAPDVEVGAPKVGVICYEWVEAARRTEERATAPGAATSGDGAASDVSALAARLATLMHKK